MQDLVGLLSGAVEGMDVGGLDHQRVALEMAPGVAKPGAHMLRQPLGTPQPNDARVVDHFRPDQHVVGVLHDGEVVVVSPSGRHGWSHDAGGTRPVENDAALSQRP